MRMEERQMEREAQQRREDREFQMQMMRMMMGPGMHSFQMPGNHHNLETLHLWTNCHPHHLHLEQIICTMPMLETLKMTVKIIIITLVMYSHCAIIQHC